MERRVWMLSAALGAAGLPLIAIGAQAAPLKVSEAAMPDVHQIAQRCWVENGVRYCERARSSNGSGYREHIPEAYPTGSSQWWEEMDRQGRGGRGGRG